MFNVADCLSLDVTGEYIRSDITGGQDGVPVVVDGQFINVNTCEPIEDLYWDIWYVSLPVYTSLHPS